VQAISEMASNLAKSLATAMMNRRIRLPAIKKPAKESGALIADGIAFCSPGHIEIFTCERLSPDGSNQNAQVY
jgi:hypothetical protein